MLCNCGLFKPQHIFKADFIPPFTEGLGEARLPWEGACQAASWPGIKPHFPLLVSAMGYCLFNPGNCVKGWGFPAGWCACDSQSGIPNEHWSAAGFSSGKVTILLVSCPAFYSPSHPAMTSLHLLHSQVVLTCLQAPLQSSH